MAQRRCDRSIHRSKMYAERGRICHRVAPDQYNHNIRMGLCVGVACFRLSFVCVGVCFRLISYRFYLILSQRTPSLTTKGNAGCCVYFLRVGCEQRERERRRHCIKPLPEQQGWSYSQRWKRGEAAYPLVLYCTTSPSPPVYSYEIHMY